MTIEEFRIMKWKEKGDMILRRTALTINAYTRRRLLASAKLGLAVLPFFIALHFAHGYGLTPGSFVLPFCFGFAIGVAELFLLKSWLKKLPFFVHLAGKSLILIVVMYLAFAVLNLLDVFIDGVTWQVYFQVLLRHETLIGMVEALGVIAFLLFFIQLDRLLVQKYRVRSLILTNDSTIQRSYRITLF